MPEINLSQKQEKELITKAFFSSPFSTIVASVLATFIIATIFLKLGGPVPISVSQTSVEKVSTFDVVGEGSVEVVPDEARAEFGITILDSSVVTAREKVNSIVDKIRADLGQLGVGEDEIKTSAYGIHPSYSFDEEGGTSKLAGYRVTSQIEVSFHDFQVLNQAVDMATGNGANLVGQLRFDLSDESRAKAEDEARKKAIDKAKRKAEKIAQEAGIVLGKIVNVKETVALPLVELQATTLEVEEEAPTEISPGLSKITVQVTLSYESL